MEVIKKMKKKLLLSALSTGVIGAAVLYGTVNFSASADQKVSAPISAQEVKKTQEVEKLAPVIRNNEEGKTKIQTLMLNSIDYFKTVKGSFEYYRSTAKAHDVINYQADFSESPKSFEKVQRAKPGAKFNIDVTSPLTPVESGYEISVYDGETISVFNSSSKGSPSHSLPVGKMSKKERDEFKGTTMNERVKTAKDGTKTYIIKMDPAHMGVSKTSVLPDSYAMGLLEDKKKWNITGQGEYLGRDTVIIKGKLSDSSGYKERTGGENFTIEVDANTGILLRLEITDQKGVLKDGLITRDIQIDTELDQSLFKNVAE